MPHSANANANPSDTPTPAPAAFPATPAPPTPAPAPLQATPAPPTPAPAPPQATPPPPTPAPAPPQATPAPAPPQATPAPAPPAPATSEIETAPATPPPPTNAPQQEHQQQEQEQQQQEQQQQEQHQQATSCPSPVSVYTPDSDGPKSLLWHEAAERVWGPIPHDRRVRWCLVQLDFPPAWYGTFPMLHTARAVQRGSHNNMTSWAAVAHSFEAVGFTPEQYYLLRMCTSRTLRDREHPLATRTTSSRGGPECHTLTASDWMLWPELIKSTTPMRATDLILNGGKSVIPDGMIINPSTGEILTTDD